MWGNTHEDIQFKITTRLGFAIAKSTQDYDNLIKVAGHIFGTTKSSEKKAEVQECEYKSFEEAQLALMGVFGGR